MRELLERALSAVRQGRTEEAAEAVNSLKALPRSREGLMALTDVHRNRYRAAGLVFPVYAAYDSACCKKEGYPDILRQLQILDDMLKEDFTFENASAFLDALIHTMEYISPEVYEYYRALIDMFRALARETIAAFCPDGKAPEAGEAAELFREAIRRACLEDVLLLEKYQSLL